jgi:hypothetical protein
MMPTVGLAMVNVSKWAREAAEKAAIIGLRTRSASRPTRRYRTGILPTNVAITNF